MFACRNAWPILTKTRRGFIAASMNDVADILVGRRRIPAVQADVCV